MAQNRRHLKRHSMPTAWPTFRKTATFAVKPKPGSMKQKYVVPVVVMLRDVLKLVHTTKEAKYAVFKKYIKLNGREVEDIKTPIGMFDILEIEKVGKKYSFIFNTYGKVKMFEVNDSNVYTKVINKTIVKGGKVQINTMSGINVLVDTKEAKKISTNATLVIDTISKKIQSVLELKESALVYVMDGKYKGLFADVVDFTHYNGVAPDLVSIKMGSENHITAKEYCFVIDEKRRVE